MKTTFYSLLCVLMISVFACNNEPATPSTPTAGLEIIPASESGIDFINTLKDEPLTDKNVLSFEYYFNGAGTGVADFNNDGLQDIFLAGNDVPNQIYINKGDFKFDKLPETSGINKNKVWASGVSIVDINDDGYPDVYVSQQGPYEASQRKNLFFINNGDLTFSEKAEEMGLADPNRTTQTVFIDYDKDGDLDCFVLNESKYAWVVLAEIYKDLEDKNNLRAASCRLLRNDGNLKFTDVTEEAGMLKYGYGLGVAVSDFNNDNWPDIYVANDYSVPDFMYINQKDGTYKDEIKEYTRQISYFAMGCDVADINNDGLVDIGVVDMAAEDHFRDKTLMAGMDAEGFKYYFYNLGYQYQYMFNSLQINNGNNTFSNIAALSGVLKSDWSWAALFADFDLDGYKDYYVSNGYRRYSRDNDFRNKIRELKEQHNGSVPLSMREEVYALLPEIKLKNKLYINDKNLHFDSEVASFQNADIETYSYGAAYADFDNDGDLDLIVNNIDQEALLLKNTSREINNNNYLKIRLEGIKQAIQLGSKVFLYHGDNIQLQEYYFQRGYESSVEQNLLFGLDKAEIVDSIKIIWADGNEQIVTNVKANQHFKIKYETQRQFKPLAQTEKPVLKQLKSSDLKIDFVHEENYFDDFETEILLPQKQTYFGPALAVGDVNNDGLDDFYVGGAMNQAGELYVQNSDGTFTPIENSPFNYDRLSEDVAAVFIDPNQDGNLDLLVISGGSGDYVGKEELLQNRFYANMGNGQFAKIANVLPVSHSASYEIIAKNIDDDPEEELLILGAAKPGKYPMVEQTVLLDYIDSKYVDVTAKLIPDLNTIDGLFRDATWNDINSDGQLDLVTVGEWQNIEIFINQDGKYTRATTNWMPENYSGWWRSIESGDLDNDGDIDFVVGNVGKNFKQKASKEHPLYLFSNDFDNNGTLDCVLAKDYNDKVVPARGRQCSSEQMPFISEKFKTYKDFASASVGDILGKEKIEQGIQLKATDFNSCILWNEGSEFRIQKLPLLAQASPVNDILIDDYNNDNALDIIIIGNDYNTEYETPRLDAGNGLLLQNNGKNQFTALRISDSGFFCPNDSKKIRKLSYGTNELILVANNNASLEFFIKS